MPSIGHDLAAVRKDKQITLEEIHSLTKIPLATLKELEDGSLFENAPDQHKTYIRSFVRSYGKALKISDDVLVEALDAFQVGIYNNQILNAQGLTSKSYPLFELDKPKEDSEKEADEELVEESAGSQLEYVATPEPPTVSSVDWVGMGKKFTDPEVKSRIWILASVFILVIIIVGVLFIYRAEIFGIGSEETEPQTTEQEATAQPESSEEPTSIDPITGNEVDPIMVVDPVAPPPPPTNLQSLNPDTLEVLVYAAFDKLEPVRVTSDFSWQTDPYWIEQGEAFRFQFGDTLLVRGQYSRMVLMMNGHLIENFRQRYFDATFNSVMITRSIFENDSTYLLPPPSNFPLEEGAPQSIINASDL